VLALFALNVAHVEAGLGYLGFGVTAHYFDLQRLSQVFHGFLGSVFFHKSAAHVVES